MYVLKFVNHCFKYDSLFKCDPPLLNVTHFFQVWPIFHRWAIFPIVIHFSECYPFLLSMTNFSDSFSLNLLFTCDPFSQMSSIFQKWPIFQVWPFFQLWPTFLSVAHFSKCYLFFRVWTILSKCIPLLTEWVFFQVRPIFSKCDLFLQV